MDRHRDIGQLLVEEFRARVHQLSESGNCVESDPSND